MCGRFSQTFSGKDLLDFFHLDRGFVPAARYNIAPSQEVSALREKEE
jgi:putative SOS response-associated peptidase YedK